MAWLFIKGDPEMTKSNKTCFLLFFIVLTFSFNAFSQTAIKVSGTVVDSLNKPIDGVSVKLISNKDTLRTHTDARGNFSFSKVKHHHFYLSLMALGYKSQAAVFEVDRAKKSIVLEPISLKTESILLQDVEIKVKVDPITVKKDTIEYNAAAYTVRENDKVEDLLKQLQGVEVDDAGRVKAMGKKMTKLRVNGEDFFTNNVEDYIRQLPADIIAKLQVIDDYGDEANFTGIKTGQPQKMLNLVTKPEMGKGVFGNLSENSGTNNAHSLNLNGNVWEKANQFGFGGNAGLTNNRFSKVNNSSFNSSIRNKINKSFSYNAGYRLSNSNNKAVQSFFTETFNPQGTIYDLRESLNQTKLLNNSLSLGLNGSNNKNYLSLSLSGALNSNRNDANSVSNKTGLIKQDLLSNANVKSKNPGISGDLNWSRRLTNTKRSLSIGLNFGRNEGQSESDISDIIKYYNESTNVLVKDSLLNRLVNNNTINSNIGGSIQFSNAIKNKGDSTSYSYLSISYRFSASRTQNVQTTTVASQLGEQVPIDSLGQDYISNFINQSIGLGYNSNLEKLSYGFGLTFSPSVILGEYASTGQRLKNYQFNFTPSGNINYQLKENSNLGFNYSGYTSTPDFNKLQPIRNTNDVQNITIGNPNLKATSSHTADLSYNQFGLKGGFSMMVGISGTFAFNSVVSNTVFLTDTLDNLKQQTTFENVNGIYNIDANYSLSRRFLDEKLIVSWNGNVGYSHNVFYTDDVLNRSSGINVINSFRVNMNQKKYSFTANTAYSYSSNTYSVLNQNISNVQIVSLGASGSWIFSPKFKINGTASKSFNFGYRINQGNPLFVNIGATGSFLKDNRLTFTVMANDLFNQGVLFRSSINNNSISENRTRFISRYVQFSFAYNINQFGGKKGLGLKVRK